MTLPKEVVLEALRCCRDVYPNEKDYLVSRKIDGYTILAVEGTNETTDWVTNLKFLIKRDDCHRGFKNNANRTLAELVVAYEGLDPKNTLILAGHSLGGAIALAIGMGLQNAPEGFAVSMPMRRAGFSRFKSYNIWI